MGSLVVPGPSLRGSEASLGELFQPPTALACVLLIFCGLLVSTVIIRTLRSRGPCLLRDTVKRIWNKNSVLVAGCSNGSLPGIQHDVGRWADELFGSSSS